MTDHLTDDRLEELFADLRADAIAEVRPPGVAAARHTVRRRRTTTSVAAGVTVLAVVGGIAAVTLRPTAPAGDSVAAHGSPASSYAEDAAQAVGFDGTGGDDGSLGTREAVTYHAVDPSSYKLRVACAGSGSLTIAVEGPLAGRAAWWRVTCALPPAPTELSLPILNAGRVMVSVRPAPAAGGDLGYAYELRPDRLDVPALPDETLASLGSTARTVVKEAAPGSTVTPSMATTIGIVNFHTAAEAPPGSYVLRIACSGTGRLTVSVNNPSAAGPDDESGGERLAGAQVPCAAKPEVREVPFAFRRGTLAVTVDPLPGALGQAGFAYSLTRS